MHIGWRRFRPAAGAVLWVGVAGTAVTAGGAGGAARTCCSASGGSSALLVGTALAPTDPAVVFSVLGRREIGGRSGTILEGESGANDPVGIALMISLLGAHRRRLRTPSCTGRGEFAAADGGGGRGRAARRPGAAAR